MERERSYLISDEKYCLLLSYAMVQHHTCKVDYIQQNQLNREQRGFLYHATGDNTYRYQLMQYTPGPVADIDLGAVLWCFKKPAKKAGGKSVRKKPADDTPTTTNLGRRCVPYSQIEAVLAYGHTGGLGGTMHYGQKTMWQRVNREFKGISRTIVRTYVKKCAV